MKRLIFAVVMLAVLSSICFAQSSIKISGSTTVLPLSQIWAEEYMKKNPNVSISVSGGGSGTGISMLLNGTVQIANSSREARPSEIAKAREKNQKLVATRLAKDGLAIVVHPKNSVKELTLAQIASIYLGKTTQWSAVGGSGGTIVPIGRDSSSGTYGFFQDAVLGGKRYTSNMRGMPSNAAVAAAVAQSENAIGYVGIAYAHDYEKNGRLKIVAVSRGVGKPALIPTDANIKDGTYPLFRYLYAYTLGNPSGLAGKFIKWCVSDEGQALVPKSGYLPLN